MHVESPTEFFDLVATELPLIINVGESRGMVRTHVMWCEAPIELTLDKV